MLNAGIKVKVLNLNKSFNSTLGIWENLEVIVRYPSDQNSTDNPILPGDVIIDNRGNIWDVVNAITVEGELNTFSLSVKSTKNPVETNDPTPGLIARASVSTPIKGNLAPHWDSTVVDDNISKMAMLYNKEKEKPTVDLGTIGTPPPEDSKIKSLQILRGTTSENTTYTGSAGSFTFDTETKEVRVHDGETPGGFIIGGVNQGPVGYGFAYDSASIYGPIFGSYLGMHFDTSADFSLLFASHFDLETYNLYINIYNRVGNSYVLSKTLDMGVDFVNIFNLRAPYDELFNVNPAGDLILFNISAYDGNETGVVIIDTDKNLVVTHSEPKESDKLNNTNPTNEITHESYKFVGTGNWLVRSRVTTGVGATITTEYYSIVDGALESPSNKNWINIDSESYDIGMYISKNTETVVYCFYPATEVGDPIYEFALGFVSFDGVRVKYKYVNGPEITGYLAKPGHPSFTMSGDLNTAIVPISSFEPTGYGIYSIDLYDQVLDYVISLESIAPDWYVSDDKIPYELLRLTNDGGRLLVRLVVNSPNGELNRIYDFKKIDGIWGLSDSFSAVPAEPYYGFQYKFIDNEEKLLVSSPAASGSASLAGKITIYNVNGA